MDYIRKQNKRKLDVAFSKIIIKKDTLSIYIYKKASMSVTNGFGAFDFLFYKRKRVKNIRTIEELRIKFQVRR